MCILNPRGVRYITRTYMCMRKCRLIVRKLVIVNCIHNCIKLSKLIGLGTSRDAVVDGAEGRRRGMKEMLIIVLTLCAWKVYGIYLRV